VKQQFLKCRLIVGLAILLFTSSAFADNPAGGSDIDITNMINSLLSLASIIQICSIAAGLGLFASSLFQFKRYGEMRTFMSHQMTIAKPLMMMLSGIMLLTLPMMIGTSLLAFWGSSTPMAYSQDTTTGWSGLVTVVIYFVRVIGIAACMRAFFMLARAGGAGAQPGTVSKAMMHLFAGVLCVNVVATTNLIYNIFSP